MSRKLRKSIAMGALLLGTLSMVSMRAYAKDHRPDIDQVLLISVDGLHALDYLNCA